MLSYVKMIKRCLSARNVFKIFKLYYYKPNVLGIGVGFLHVVLPTYNDGVIIISVIYVKEITYQNK